MATRTTIYLKRLGTASIEFILEIDGKIKQSGRSLGFKFDDKNNIFTARNLRAENVTELVFYF